MAAPTRPGNQERGWNDPPEFLHLNAQGQPEGQVQESPRKGLLNKRVAHPGLFTRSSKENTDAASFSTSPPVPNVILLPPATSTQVPQFTAPIIIPGMTPGEADKATPSSLPSSPPAVATNPVTNTQVSTTTGTGDLGIPNFDNDEQLYHFVISRLQKVLSDCERIIQPRVTDEIKKKLDILANMWQHGKISYKVKSTMARLATALHRRRCDEAHELHLSLIMDYVSEVSQWMVGVKRLIQEARNVDGPLSPTDTTVNPTLAVTAAAATAAAGEEEAAAKDAHKTGPSSAAKDTESPEAESLPEVTSSSNNEQSTDTNSVTKQPEMIVDSTVAKEEETGEKLTDSSKISEAATNSSEPKADGQTAVSSATNPDVPVSTEVSALSLTESAENKVDHSETESAENKVDHSETESAENKVDHSETESAENKVDHSETESAENKVDHSETESAENKVDHSETESAENKVDHSETESAENKVDHSETESAENKVDHSETESAENKVDHSETESAENKVDHSETESAENKVDHSETESAENKVD